MFKRLFYFVVMAIFTVITATSQLYADAKTRVEFPVQVQLLSNSLGSGVLVGNNFNSTVYAGFEVTSKSVDETFSEVSVSGDFPTAQFNMRFSTWDDSGFFLQLGAVFYDWTIEGKGAGYIDTQYTSSEVLKVTWSGVSPSFGLGWNWIGDSGFSGGISLAAFSLAPPTVTIEDENNLATPAQIETEEKDAEETFAYLNAASVFTISLGWNF